jgi:hypothetical protein
MPLEESRRDGTMPALTPEPQRLTVEKHSQKGSSTQRSLHYAPPDFLSRLVALMICMRLSLWRAANEVVAGSAK